MDNSGTYRCTDNQLNPIIHFIFRLTDSIKLYTCIVSKWVLVFFFFINSIFKRWKNWILDLSIENTKKY